MNRRLIEDFLPIKELSAEALGCLRCLWGDPEIWADVKRWLELGQRLEALSGSVRDGGEEVQAEWKRLIEERRAIEERAPSQELLARVVSSGAIL